MVIIYYCFFEYCLLEGDILIWVNGVLILNGFGKVVVYVIDGL